MYIVIAVTRDENTVSSICTATENDVGKRGCKILSDDKTRWELTGTETSPARRTSRPRSKTLTARHRNRSQNGNERQRHEIMHCSGRLKDRDEPEGEGCCGVINE